MCLCVDPMHDKAFNKLKAGIADKHYTVYKVVKRSWHRDNDYVTPYRGARVVFGRLERSRIVFYNCFGNTVTVINEGLHSCRTLETAERLRKENKKHSICTAIIPKGSKLYYGVDGDVVSNKLIIFENNEAMNKWLSEH